MFVSWAETKSICNASSSKVDAVFSNKLLHPSLDLCMANVFVNDVPSMHTRKCNTNLQSRHMILEDMPDEKDNPIHQLF